MPASSSDSVAGDLGSTPLAHILVYAADRRLTGALSLEDPTGARHVVRFVEGAPVKVRPGDGYALLGELLVDAGAISQAALDAALSFTRAREGLLGDALILRGATDHATVEGIVIEQFWKRMIRLFELPAETRFTYINGDPELCDWGGDAIAADPLAILWAGLREHGHCSSMMDRTLQRLGTAPIRLHPAGALARFGFTAGELAAVNRVKEAARPLAELLSGRIAPQEALRRLLYTLLITRHLDFGGDALPVGVSAPVSLDGSLAPPRSVGDGSPSAGAPASTGASPSVGAPPSASASLSAGAPVSAPVGKPLGRLQLRTVAVPLGAAAPDLPGDGDRFPPRPSRPRK